MGEKNQGGGVADNFFEQGEPIDPNELVGGDVDLRARLKQVGRDQSNGEDAMVNSLGESIPQENPGVGLGGDGTEKKS